MTLSVETNSYHLLSKIIHWVTALLIFGLLFIGFYMTSLDFSEYKLQLYALHKSFGLLVLALACVRVTWHVIKRRPKPLSTHQKWERFLSHSAHLFLYGVLFVMPLSGWVMSSSGDFTIQFFGVNVPDIVQKNEGIFNTSREVHEIIAFALLFVLGLHILGAFKHHFIDRDITLNRMTWSSLGVSGGAIFALVVAILYVPSGLYAIQNIQKQYAVPLIEGQAPTSLHVHDQTHNHSVHAGSISDVTEWVLDLNESAVQFEAAQYGQTFEGEFKIRGGKIFFDEERLSESKVSIEIDIASIYTGSSDRDTQAVSAEWFEVNTFPNALFEAIIFEKLESNHFLAKGSLNIRGVMLPIDLPFTLEITEGNGGNKRAIMTSSISLNRLDFGIGQGNWHNTDVIGDVVKLHITAAAFMK